MNDPKNPFMHGSAKATRHDVDYAERLAREAARKDANARILMESFKAPVWAAPVRSSTLPGRRALSSAPTVAFVPRGDASAAKKTWNIHWMWCGVLLVILLLAAHS